MMMKSTTASLLSGLPQDSVSTTGSSRDGGRSVRSTQNTGLPEPTEEPALGVTGLPEDDGKPVSSTEEEPITDDDPLMASTIPSSTGPVLVEEPMTVQSNSEDVQEVKTKSEEEEEQSQFSPHDEAIQEDAANRVVALIVHFALAFFVILTAVASFMAITLVSKFGFLAFLLILLLLSVVCGIAYFVDYVMKEDAHWKPVRRQIRRWKAVATAVVLEEIRMFQRDWNEHLLLTDGKAAPDDYDFLDYITANDDMHATIAKASQDKSKSKRGRGRSVLFKAVKPFLKIGGRRRRRRKEREDATASAAAADTTAENYIPPVV